MALERYPDIHAGTGETDNITVDRHLYLTEDKARVVEEGDPDGRWLWAAPGHQVPRAEAQRLGAIQAAPSAMLLDAGYDPDGVAELVEGGDGVVSLEQVEAQAKQAKPAANKARKPAANKVKPAPETGTV